MVILKKQALKKTINIADIITLIRHNKHKNLIDTSTCLML